MADRQKNIHSHYWYQKRYHIRLADKDISKDWIFASGLLKIHQHIADKGYLNTNGVQSVAAASGEYGGVWINDCTQRETNGVLSVFFADVPDNSYGSVT